MIIKFIFIIRIFCIEFRVSVATVVLFFKKKVLIVQIQNTIQNKLMYRQTNTFDRVNLVYSLSLSRLVPIAVLLPL